MGPIELLPDLSILASSFGSRRPSLECSGIPFGITASGWTSTPCHYLQIIHSFEFDNIPLASNGSSKTKRWERGEEGGGGCGWGVGEVDMDVDEEGYEGPPCLRWPTWYINLWSPSRESEFMGEGITRCGRADALHPNLYRANFFKPTMCLSCVPRVQRVLCVPFVFELAPLVPSKLLKTNVSCVPCVLEGACTEANSLPASCVTCFPCVSCVSCLFEHVPMF